MSTTRSAVEETLGLCEELRGSKLTKRRDAMKSLPNLLKVESVLSAFDAAPSASLDGSGVSGGWSV